MDIERPQRTASTPTTTSELFICFTSRLSHSSSMRLSSKSILSPGRAGEKSAGSHSLTTSLSRRLRHNGSLRGGGGQSPAMFSSKKNRGGPGFENPEPSSPKVTCIGQVRVKTKKQGKKMKMRACRSKSKRLSGGEASFRRIEHGHGGGLTPQNSLGIQNQPQDRNLPHRNQRWVHLPLTICEALRAFGAEFSCLLPCKSSCFSSCNNEREKGEKRDGSNTSSSCGAVCRWLVALQEGEEKGRDIELVVGEEERGTRERMVMERECSRRRSIFDDMEFNDELLDVKNGDNGKEEEEEEEAARVSICIPPKNALLLMRCRSDPMKMSALSQKIWEAPVVAGFNDGEGEEEEEEDGEEENEEDDDVKEVCSVSEMGGKTEEVSEAREKLGEGCVEIDEMCKDLGMDKEPDEGYDMGSEDLAIFAEEEQKPEEKKEEQEQEQEDETEEKQSIENRGEAEEEEGTQLMEEENQPKEYPPEAVLVEESLQNGENEQDLVKITEEEEGEKAESSEISSSSSSVEESTAESQENQGENDPEKDQEMIKSMEEEEEEEEEPPLEDQSQQELTHHESEPIPAEKPKEDRENKPKWEEEQEIDKPVLPDCLLLMMCEPKLSMEVSKETWVCSTDFIRWLPERHPKKPNKTDGSGEPKKKKAAPPPPQPAAPPVQVAVHPARSSISFPTGGGPVANLIEQKLAKAGGGIEPFVLTRCKSAPIRSTAKNAPPELPCSLWRRESSRKIEPHRPSFGATGVGF